MRLLIAGGGTGGHLFPGVALAEELRAREPGAQIRFVGTRRGIEARVLPQLGWELSLIEVSGLKTVGALGALRGLLRLPRALWQARRVVRDFAPDAVIGVGGYASGPVVLMARLRGVPTAICEQNSIPGLTNRILGRVARVVFVSFDGTKRFFKSRKTVVSGNPVRRELVQRLLGGAIGTAAGPAAAPSGLSAETPPAGATAAPSGLSAETPPAGATVAPSGLSAETPPALAITAPSRSSAGPSASAPAAPAGLSAETPPAGATADPSEAAGPGDRVHVLVSGGSLGALAVNDLASQALIALARTMALSIVHQTGDKGLDATVKRYADAGIAAECRAFIADMASAYQRADLIISRAGATTVAELAIAGKPAVFIPYPFAADNHQEVNAREMAEAGAALVFRQSELTADKLANALRPLVGDAARRTGMGARMKSLARPGAAATVIDWCESQQRARR